MTSAMYQFAIAFATLAVCGQILATPIISIDLLRGEPQQAQQVNDRPIIAVLTQRHRPLSHNQSYLAASYVKYLESSGARVVIIPHHYTEAHIRQLFGYVNGFLLPGGGIKLFTSAYYKHAKVFWDMAIEANKKGDYFPIWGTCMGFEVMQVLQTNEDILSHLVSNDKALPLKFLDGAKSSKLFRGASKEQFELFGTQNVTWNHHSQGVTRQTYNDKEKLSSFFDILSVNTDEFGHEFISTIEAKKFPFYGVQWHPEKNNFEHRRLYKEFPNGANGVLTSQYFANFFVNEARKSTHKFPSEAMEDKYLVYNHNPVRYADEAAGGVLSHFEQVYVIEG